MRNQIPEQRLNLILDIKTENVPTLLDQQEEIQNNDNNSNQYALTIYEAKKDQGIIQYNSDDDPNELTVYDEQSGKLVKTNKGELSKVKIKRIKYKPHLGLSKTPESTLVIKEENGKKVLDLNESNIVHSDIPLVKRNIIPKIMKSAAEGEKGLKNIDKIIFSSETLEQLIEDSELGVCNILAMIGEKESKFIDSKNLNELGYFTLSQMILQLVITT